MSATRKLRIFRIEEGHKIPYILELSSDLVVVAEYAENELKTGEIRTVVGSTQATISTLPEKEHKMARWAAPIIEENPIAGSESLREAYLQERRELELKHEKNKKTCPPCEIGKLIRKYKSKLKAAGLL